MRKLVITDERLNEIVSEHLNDRIFDSGVPRVTVTDVYWDEEEQHWSIDLFEDEDQG